MSGSIGTLTSGFPPDGVATAFGAGPASGSPLIPMRRVPGSTISKSRMSAFCRGADRVVGSWVGERSSALSLTAERSVMGFCPTSAIVVWVAVMHDFSHRTRRKPRPLYIGSLASYLEPSVGDKRATRKGEDLADTGLDRVSARPRDVSPEDQTSAGAPARRRSWAWTVAL